ncbi:TIGR03013 family XrtA/PEP-CTERM system glycosyltransferase [Dokdonella immobilis]|uniref:Sugar transferase, PEP-CTERM system associated/exopolysaccharide biosynthesis polyprenyl glycosylphosphotransferase n=1 Tax=Dokdonella immobilis TaxID=578942 RepID=A0A1I4VF08_9GAMM|nr:TIGR03013 family XrtA/PEP-CTERM system glycosyltransferase [Dokdonella immobilis]SFM99758.1 sugar transferase, PEP-CTERM system associated/exopolysaccharide biosynthesis polyprenyl glycosylphosphotransferase [Dokdonella immobilis]
MLRFLREQGARWLLVLAVAEFLVLVGALILAMRIRFWSAPEDLAAFSILIEVRATLFGLVMVTSMAAIGMYQKSLRDNLLGLIARQTIGFVMGGIATAFLFYLVPQLFIGRGVIGYALLISFPIIAFGRALFLRLVDIKALKRRVLVLGVGARAEKIVHRMRRRVDRRGFLVVGFLPMNGEAPVVPDELVVKSDKPLAEIAERMQINEIVIAAEDRRGQLPMHDLLACKQRGITITNLITFFEREQGKVKLSLIDPSWLIFSQGFDATPLRKASKRIFDVTSTAIMLLVLWPLMVLTALAIWIESGPGAPILYRQERVGERGKPFPLIKFRSMRTDAEKDGVARWASKEDDRVTRVGRFIRKVRLDELPQLWNVLRGDMSLIGPRPERPQFVAELEKKIQYYDLRHCVKPGLAGWAQLNYPYGADEKDAAEKLKYDLFYVKNHNFTLDLIILIQTFEVILFRRGAR